MPNPKQSQGGKIFKINLFGFDCYSRNVEVFLEEWNRAFKGKKSKEKWIIRTERKSLEDILN